MRSRWRENRTADPASSRTRYQGGIALPLWLYPVHQGPRHPRFATVLARRSSFDEWPPALKQTPEAMADAGFIYLGLSDQVGLTCFWIAQLCSAIP